MHQGQLAYHAAILIHNDSPHTTEAQVMQAAEDAAADLAQDIFQILTSSLTAHLGTHERVFNGMDKLGYEAGSPRIVVQIFATPCTYHPPIQNSEH